MVYSALFINVFKALNLFLNKYEAEIPLQWQWHSAALYTSELWHGLALVISITTCKVQMLLQLAACLQLSISDQAVDIASPFKIPITVKHAAPSLLQLIWAR
jgi:hypothetical protein